MDKIQIGDVLIMDGKSYVSLKMYKDLQNLLDAAQDAAEYFLQRLTAIEVANENRRGMKIINGNSYEKSSV